MDACTVAGCKSSVSRKGHKLCKPHWTADQAGSLSTCPDCSARFDTSSAGCPRCKSGTSMPYDSESMASGSGHLTATDLGKPFGVNAKRMNLVLAELGWLEKYTKGWKPTAQGIFLGGQERVARQNGIPYVVWPSALLTNRALKLSLDETKEGTTPAAGSAEFVAESAEPYSSLSADFRTKFPPKHRTKDGHMVRSRGEMLIDNFLYDQGIVHAYERRLPLSEDCYSDFYLPQKQVYLEYWGLEGKPAYESRKAEKKAIYARNRFNLLEITDDHIAAPDDELPKLLLKFGIACT